MKKKLLSFIVILFLVASVVSSTIAASRADVWAVTIIESCPVGASACHYSTRVHYRDGTINLTYLGKAPIAKKCIYDGVMVG